MECATKFDPSNPEHRLRYHTMITRPSGRKVVPGTFSTVLKKVGIRMIGLRCTADFALFRALEYQKKQNSEAISGWKLKPFLLALILESKS